MTFLNITKATRAPTMVCVFKVHAFEFLGESLPLKKYLYNMMFIVDWLTKILGLIGAFHFLSRHLWAWGGLGAVIICHRNPQNQCAGYGYNAWQMEGGRDLNPPPPANSLVCVQLSLTCALEPPINHLISASKVDKSSWLLCFFRWLLLFMRRWGSWSQRFWRGGRDLEGKWLVRVLPLPRSTDT